MPDDVAYFCANTTKIENDPITVEDVLIRSKQEHLVQAMTEEMQFFQEDDKQELVDTHRQRGAVQADVQNEVRCRK